MNAFQLQNLAVFVQGNSAHECGHMTVQFKAGRFAVARAKGKTLGRPRMSVDAARIGRLRIQGRSVREIASELGYSRGLVHKTLTNGRSR
jgi:DNA invertase Pin-like site-specific DNA recombinase